MIVIGVDTHKRTHTLVALDVETGGLRGQRTIESSDAGALEALRFAGQIDSERVWALEDCRQVSARLERALLAGGERVIRVAPGVMGESRKASRVPGKSDPIDARMIALAAIREGVESFPAAFLDERAMEIRVLCDYRDQLISERTRLIESAALAPRRDRPAARGAIAARRAQRPTHPRSPDTAARQAPAQPPAARGQGDPQADQPAQPRGARAVLRAHRACPRVLAAAPRRARSWLAYRRGDRRSHRRR